MRGKILGLLGVGMFAAPFAANATLIGNSITVDWLYPDAATEYASDTVTVGAGAEISCPGAYDLCSGFVVGADIDIGADTISLLVTSGNSSWNGTSFNGYRFSDLSVGGAWSSVSLSSNFGGLDASRYSFDGSTLLVNMQGLAANRGDYFEFSLVSVPEPATLSLLGAGLLAFGFGKRRRRDV